MNHARNLAESIDHRAEALSQRVVEQHLKQRPDLVARFGEAAHKKCLEDGRYHLRYLCVSLQTQRPSLFHDYAKWAQQLLAAYGIPTDELVEYLALLQQTLLKEFPSSHQHDLIKTYFDSTIRLLRRQPLAVASFLPGETASDALANQFMKLLLEGRRTNAADLILNAVDDGTSIKDIYLSVFQPVQYEVGRLWHRGELTVAQEHFCTAVTQWVMSRLYPQLFTGESGRGRIVAACVAGDLHEVGLRMVTDLLELEGWDTCYVGANTPISAIVDMVARENAQILALSATMAYHLGPLERTIELLRQDSKFSSVKVMVGGRPFLIEPTLVQAVGANAMAKNAEDALIVAKQLVESSDESN